MNRTATKFLAQYRMAVATASDAENTNAQFAIAPPIETKLRQAITFSDAFLSMISVLAVDQIAGQVVDVGVGKLLTGRGDGTRFRAELSNDGNTYSLVETDSCGVIKWGTLTQWANSGSAGEFIKLMNAAITRSFALDMLRVGFNGTSAATVTDPVANPLGEDINKGWLQVVKDKAAAQVLAAADLDPTGTVVDSYKNLDSLVQDLVNTTIHEAHRQSPDLVVLVGGDLVAAEQHRLLEAASTPTEHKAAQTLAKTIAGKTAYTPPFFPPTAVWVTTLKTLQILQQKGTQWRKVANSEDRKQVENSFLRAEGYAVGDFNKFAAIETVTIA
ncbi:MAG: P2 family phage major capsid protein [Psychromonas sp.]|jgi:P2 family phage major capsid protein|uniref:phage major capsid protein, P2 family n=1 Tax=Psychromonas sp. TaxID=1884585 RepID=UPI0039E31150